MEEEKSQKESPSIVSCQSKGAKTESVGHAGGKDKEGNEGIPQRSGTIESV
jgi:hypothetical protein